jgi:hypothetical protein
MTQSTEQIGSIFREEIINAGGTVHECFDDGSRLFVRSILPSITEVLPGDRMQGGVALRASDAELSVHPYTFRLVCTNGAIHAHAIQSRQIILGDSIDEMSLQWELREAIRACCCAEAFVATADEMRASAGDNIDLLLNVSALLARMPRDTGHRFLASVMDQARTDRHGTRYDLANHITAAARTIRDPEAKWRTEALGGAVAAGTFPLAKPDVSRAKHPELVGI